ncbi:cytochrome c, mono- and diheme variants family [Bernardetia litoralis DSM 6794]|uniref:Cytochrome c, mono-and diheme variants family n=2 Tax=Bernardetia litoralis TaxID=999 RepID=I4AJP3_BERLS|nr:cytochrome c, mono- and diheme variants family [Bernardetia litoralis DSM 6794]
MKVDFILSTYFQAMKKLLSVFIVVFAFCFTSCSDSENTQNDRIANMSAEELAYNFPHLFDSPPPQEFVIDTEQDTVIFGKSGTLLAIEAGTFTDENGNPLKGKLTLNLKEALSLSDMLENKLTTQTQDGQILQSGGMFEFTAKSDKKGKINISKSIHAEVPTQQKIGDMSVYEGIQVSEGAPVQWKKEKELENWLTEIPLERLDFFPKNNITEDEGYVSANQQLDNNSSESIFRFVQEAAEEPKICGISKYILEGLSDKKFQGTFISTYEFEKRLKVMNECCGNDLIAIYLKNLDKNLWESDKLAAEYLTKNKKCRASIFEEFAAEKATKVKPKGKVNRALQKYINKIFKNKEKAWAKFKTDFDKWDKKKEKLQTEVVEKLENERKFSERLNYSFDLNRLGWTNIDMLMKYPNQIAVDFDIKVKGLELKEAGRVFLIFPNEKIIVDLSRNEKGNFYGKQGNENVIYLPKGTDIILKAVTGKNKQLYTGELDLVIKSKIKKTIKTTETTDKKVADRIKEFEQQRMITQTVSNPSIATTSFTRNPIITRRDFSAKKFEQALENHYKSKPVLEDYKECCFEIDLVKGKQLFENDCRQCHAIHKKIVGSALAGSESRWGNRQYLIEFIRYPEKVIMESRETDNIYPYRLYEEYGQMMPNHDHLSDDDISSILDYIETESKKYSYSDFKEKEN